MLFIDICEIIAISFCFYHILTPLLGLVYLIKGTYLQNSREFFWEFCKFFILRIFRRNLFLWLSRIWDFSKISWQLFSQIWSSIFLCLVRAKFHVWSCWFQHLVVHCPRNLLLRELIFLIWQKLIFTNFWKTVLRFERNYLHDFLLKSRYQIFSEISSMKKKPAKISTLLNEVLISFFHR